MTEHDDDYQEDWAFYLSYVDEDNVGSFGIDLGLNEIAPVKEKPVLVWVSIALLHQHENGLACHPEEETLFAIEDGFAAMFAARYDAIYAGRLTIDGHRDFYFYVADASECESNVAKVMADYPDYKCRTSVRDDVDWECYFEFLYPMPQQYQSIQNQRVVQHLEAHDDDLSQERLVEHWAYFKNETDRDTFVQKITSDGFAIEDTEPNEEAGDFPYSVHFSRVDKVDYQSIDQCVIPLWELANEYNGNYDGWETVLCNGEDE